MTHSQTKYTRAQIDAAIDCVRRRVHGAGTGHAVSACVTALFTIISALPLVIRSACVEHRRLMQAYRELL